MQKKYQNTLNQLPHYLKSYVVEQNYEKYTPRDQAVWRFIMKNSQEFFSQFAHPIYLHGLQKTGVPLDKIPRVDEMNELLSEFGWGAVCVSGFIPPLVFLEFQSKKILPIAADMRSLEHIAYTPAPDIVHEAAGHAPIIADPDYRNYLTEYAQVARKAIFSKEDVRLYEAIRALSDTKENPDSTPDEIIEAERKLTLATQAVSWVSEAAKVARMYWWTVEYGMIGSVSKPLIYGAGLLSSLGESRLCLSDKVKKVPFDIKCVEQSYDITEPQPQLFVADSFASLTQALRELEDQLAFKKGGINGLLVAEKAQTVTTTLLDSGISISGIVEQHSLFASNLSFIRWQGPVQLCLADREIKGQGTSRHAHGFSCPLGRWTEHSDRDPWTFTKTELTAWGYVEGKPQTIDWISGFHLSGIIKHMLFDDKTKCLLLITWDQCQLQAGDQIYYQPSWGEYDLIFGKDVESVFSGPGDWEKFGEYDFGRASSSPARTSPYSEQEKRLFALYAEIRTLRGQGFGHSTLPILQSVLTELAKHFADEWLLGVEVYELFSQGIQKKLNHAECAAAIDTLCAGVLNMDKYPKDLQTYIKMGMVLASSDSVENHV